MTARRVFAAAVLLAGWLAARWLAARWAKHPDDMHDVFEEAT